MRQLEIVNGPNNNFYGIRNKGQYGTQTYADLIADLTAFGAELGWEVHAAQFNGEGDLIDHLQQIYYRAEASGTCIPLVINPGAFTHYSIAVMDALESVHTLVPAIECHMSNIHKREDFRHVSFTARESIGQIAGFGPNSYKLALYEFKLLADAGMLDKPWE